jgi:hypothetical protein
MSLSERTLDGGKASVRPEHSRGNPKKESNCFFV